MLKAGLLLILELDINLELPLISSFGKKSPKEKIDGDPYQHCIRLKVRRPNQVCIQIQTKMGAAVFPAPLVTYVNHFSLLCSITGKSLKLP